MIPKEVKIDGKPLKDVTRVEFHLAKAPDEKGFPCGETCPVEIVITRTATGNPSPQGFALVTNRDGRIKFVTGEIVLQDNEKKETYALTLEEAYGRMGADQSAKKERS